MILFFDTETTGKYDFRASPDAHHQPHLVQLGAILVDASWNVRDQFAAVVKPKNWIIPDEAAKVHGITTEIAQAVGSHLTDVLHQFAGFCRAANLRIAHNLQFDDAVMETAFARTGDVWHKTPIGFCTMHAMTDVCKIPGNYGDYKWPRLAEAYKHVTGKEFVGAHDAMADVLACVDVYRWYVTNKANLLEAKA